MCLAELGKASGSQGKFVYVRGFNLHVVHGNRFYPRLESGPLRSESPVCTSIEVKPSPAAGMRHFTSAPEEHKQNETPRGTEQVLSHN